MSRLNSRVAVQPQGYMAGFIVALMFVSCALASDDQTPVRPASVSGNTEELYGMWDGGGRASRAIYGTMIISKSRIAWGGDSNGKPQCTVNYQRMHESHGVRFRDQTDNNYVTAYGESRYTTYLLKITGGKCALGITHFRLTLDGDSAVGYLAMVEYYKSTDAVGRLHFFRN